MNRSGQLARIDGLIARIDELVDADPVEQRSYHPPGQPPYPIPEPATPGPLGLARDAITALTQHIWRKRP